MVKETLLPMRAATRICWHSAGQTACPIRPGFPLGSTGKGASTQSGLRRRITPKALVLRLSLSRPVKRKPGFGLKEAVELRAVTKQMEALQANITDSKAYSPRRIFTPQTRTASHVPVPR